MQTSPNSTVPPDETAGHLSVVSGTNTFWDNSAYILFETIGATNKCGPLGPTLSRAIITLRSSEVSSLRGFYGTKPYSFNFADLVEPVPYIAWVAQRDCQFEETCATISGVFKPNLMPPPQARTLDPLWGSCFLSFRGIFDPPTAVGTVPFLASTAEPTQPTPTAASENTPFTSQPTPTIVDPGSTV
jgi:hypothetical protein